MGDRQPGRVASHPCGKYHVAYVTDQVILWGVAESSIVNEAIGHTAWSCPSPDAPRRVLMCHIDVEVVVADELEKHDFASVRGMCIRPELADRCFQRLNIRRPQMGEKLMSRQDRRSLRARRV